MIISQTLWGQKVLNDTQMWDKMSSWGFSDDTSYTYDENILKQFTGIVS
jgi:hypothetical protein